MKIKVEVNGLVYDSSNPKCKCILSNSQRKLYAFQCNGAGSGRTCQRQKIRHFRC